MKIYLLTNLGFSGDNNQLKGIKLAIQSTLKNQQCEFKEIEEDEFDINLLVNGDFVFVSGSHGLLLTEAIKRHDPNHQVLWSGHQYFSELSSIQHLPDIIALPETALSESQKTELMEKTKLIITSSVAHCVNNKTVEEEYARFKGKLPDNFKFRKQVGIILAGDAPEPNGKMKYFTEDDAKQQASHIAKYLVNHGYDKEDTAIMITNGPRTGKYVPDTGGVRSPDPHHCGHIDLVSRAFIEKFREMIAHSQIFFYDFQFDDLKNGPSAYKPMMKQVADSKDGLWVVPSESISMVTESSFLLEKRKIVVIYHPSSENSVHLAHAANIVSCGLALDIRHTRKLADESVLQYDAEHRTAVCSSIHEKTKQGASSIEFRNISNEESLKLSQASTKSATTQISEAFCTQLRKKIMSNHLALGFFGFKNPSGDSMELNARRHFCGYF